MTLLIRFGSLYESMVSLLQGGGVTQGIELRV